MAEPDREGARPDNLVAKAGRAREKKEPVEKRGRCASVVQAKMPLTTSP